MKKKLYSFYFEEKAKMQLQQIATVKRCNLSEYIRQIIDQEIASVDIEELTAEKKAKLATEKEKEESKKDEVAAARLSYIEKLKAEGAEE